MDILERIRNVYKLANSGVGGEKQNAEALLQKLLKKHHLTLDDIEENKPEYHEFEVHGQYERKLLVQVAFKVLNEPATIYRVRVGESYRYSPTRFSLYCTNAQFIEIDFLLNFYIDQWKIAMDDMMMAFIQKHEIFGDKIEGLEPTKMSVEESMRIGSIMAGINQATPYRQIEGETG